MAGSVKTLDPVRHLLKFMDTSRLGYSIIQVAIKKGIDGKDKWSLID